MKEHELERDMFANLAQVEEQEEVDEAEAEMRKLQTAYTTSSSGSTSTSASPTAAKVSSKLSKPCNNTCCPECVETIAMLRKSNDRLKRSLEDEKYAGYEARKGFKPLKEKLDAKLKDFSKLHEEYSV